MRYIPDLKRNLLSLGVFDAAGYSYKAQGGFLKIFKGILMALKGRLENGLYVLEGSTVLGESDTVQSTSEETELWHMRLGHMSQRGIQELCKQGLISIKKIKELTFCETCVMGKAHRLSFTKATHNTIGTLDYIHSDLWGSPNSVYFKMSIFYLLCR